MEGAQNPQAYAIGQIIGTFLILAFVFLVIKSAYKAIKKKNHKE